MYVLRAFGIKIRRSSELFFRWNSTKVTYAQTLSPNEFSFESYDMIGFDLDHTICKYKLKPLFELIYKSLSSFLVEKYNYPDLLLKMEPHEVSFAQKGIVLDKSRGNFLKLNHNYRILQATHGTKLMTEEDICSVYGRECTWEETRGIPSKLCIDTSLEEPFYVFKDYFVIIGALVCAKIVDILDEQNKGPLLAYTFWDHFLDGLFYMYERNNFRNNGGQFFPALKQNPHLYLEPCSQQSKDWLRSIGQKKITFLLTSSNFDSAAFLAKFCLGEDWASYFDIIVTFARKPGFFRKQNPFFSIEDNMEMCQVKSEDIKRHEIYTQGNWKDLYNLCKVLCRTDSPKALYVGDSVVEDVFAASTLACCETLGIVEEMLAEGMEGTVDVPLEQSNPLLSEFWGSYFCSEGKLGKKDRTLSLWASVLSQHSKLAVPNLHILSSLGVQEKASSFSREFPAGGYFPAPPKILTR